MNYIFKVILEAPLGQRHGTLKLSCENNGTIFGILEIFGQVHGVTGLRNTDGSCQIIGAFSTLHNRYEFQACGNMDDENIILQVKAGNGHYRMTGTISEKSEEEL